MTLFAIATGLLLSAYRQATVEPVMRTTRVAMSSWPQGTPPLRVALLSDLHVAGPDMPPDRLADIVERVNAAFPDVVLIAGDFVSDKRVATRTYTVDQAVAPLNRLRPPLGVWAVPGNHDHWRGIAAFERALPMVGVHLLRNRATEVGPLVLLGLDDEFTGHADWPVTRASAGSLSGPRIMLSHTPDPAAALRGQVDLVLAGHTHCGQAALPLIGRPATMSRYGDRFACGRVETGPTVIVGAGLGTSLLPIRWDEPPDWWLVTLGPVPN